MAKKRKKVRESGDRKITRDASREGQNHKLANALMKVIKDKQWSLADLSRESGVSIGHLSRLISGDRGHSPTLRTIEALAKVCGIEMRDLL